MSRNTLNHEFYIILQFVFSGFAFAGISVNMRGKRIIQNLRLSFTYIEARALKGMSDCNETENNSG